jgi:Spy/CpxP family protein refolding chaperone
MRKALRIFILITSTAVLFAAATDAFAQQGPAGSRDEDMTGFGNPPRRGNAMSEQKREELRKKIEAVRIWRLTETLKLDAATSAKLAPLLNAYDQQRKDIMREQMETMKELRHALKTSKPDETKLKTALEKLVRNRHAMDELRDKEINGMKEILTIEQQARFVLFQHEFRREMLGMIAGAREGGPGPGKKGDGRRQGGPLENK